MLLLMAQSWINSLSLVDFGKQKSRDNSMYQISDGYNLHEKEDKFLEKLIALNLLDNEGRETSLKGRLKFSQLLKDTSSNLYTNDYS
jgi:hypothetical protein